MHGLVIVAPPPAIGRWLFGAVAVGLALCALPASGQPLRSNAPSADWYADHPAERAAVVEICRQHPGPARGNDNCAAAWQGNIVAAEREGQRRAAAAAEEARRNRGDTTPPSSPEYWRRRPEERAEHLAWCDRMDEAAQAKFFCVPARQAADRATDPPPAKPQRGARRT